MVLGAVQYFVLVLVLFQGDVIWILFFLFLCLCWSVCIYVYLVVCMFVVFVYLLMCVCVCVCVFVFNVSNEVEEIFFRDFVLFSLVLYISSVNTLFLLCLI